ncbi:MAG: hypothetical protein U9R42_12395, partial [Bacteroidota bacterium]|nr:hypothetical protein [Bacteroidota bacterium]
YKIVMFGKMNDFDGINLIIKYCLYMMLRLVQGLKTFSLFSNSKMHGIIKIVVIKNKPERLQQQNFKDIIKSQAESLK